MSNNIKLGSKWTYPSYDNNMLGTVTKITGDDIEVTWKHTDGRLNVFSVTYDKSTFGVSFFPVRKKVIFLES